MSRIFQRGHFRDQGSFRGGLAGTAWEEYTPTFQGLGSPTNIQFVWRRVGDSVEIQGKWTNGTTTASEIRVGLPTGLTSSDTGKIQSIKIIGQYSFGVATNVVGYTLIEPSVDYLTLGYSNEPGNHALQKLLGTEIGSSLTLSLFATVPIQGWAALLETPQSAVYSEVFVHTGNNFGSTNTRIRRFSTLLIDLGGDSITYTDSAANGGLFTINKEGIYSITYNDRSEAGDQFGISLNAGGTTGITALAANLRLTQIYPGVSNWGSSSVTLKLYPSDVIAAHSQGGAGATYLSNNAVSFRVTRIG